jgi:hypothetical protein
MEAHHERREGGRRESDRVIEWRVATLETRLGSIDATLVALGSSTAHLALLDARSDENRRRIESLEASFGRMEESLAAIRVSLEGARVRITMICALASFIGSGLVAAVISLIH